MKDISTLVEDIYGLFEGQGVSVRDEDAEEFGKSLAYLIKSRLETGDQERYLRFSNVGTDCDRKLFYSINQPNLGEPLPPPTRIKFLFGDILEALLLFLARTAGHSVSGQQSKMEFEGLVGSRDAVIDGHLIDVKSASTFSFRKFEEGLNDSNDAFGYRDQLGLYLEASQKDPLVENKDKAYFLVIDKTLGHITLSPLKRDKTKNWPLLIERKRMMLSSSSLPKRAYFPEPEGKSGNEGLGVACSYCQFKEACFPNLRTFIYSNGPKFLTKVARLPNVPEVTRGKR